MTLVDLAEGVLRVFGAIYAAAAVFMLWQLRTSAFMDKAIIDLERIAADLAREAGESAPRPTPVDTGRTAWLAAGGVLLFAAGVTMALGLRLSVVALGLLALHQLAYFVRQRRRELAAATAEEAEDERPTQATRNGFVFGLLFFVVAGWLESQGALS
jgi:hypothetical protein